MRSQVEIEPYSLLTATAICRQKALDTTLGKNGDDGLYPSLLSEGCRVQHSAKISAMGSTLSYIPLLKFLLGAAIDPLSQQTMR